MGLLHHSLLEEWLHNVEVPTAARLPQCRVPTAVHLVHVRVVPQQQIHDVRAASLAGPVEHRRPVEGLGGVRIGPVLQQTHHRLNTAAAAAAAAAVESM